MVERELENITTKIMPQRNNSHSISSYKLCRVDTILVLFLPIEIVPLSLDFSYTFLY